MGNNIKLKEKKRLIPTDFVTSSNPSRRTTPHGTLSKKRQRQNKSQTHGLVVSSFVPFFFHSKLESFCPNFFPFFSSSTNTKKCRPEVGYMYVCRIIHLLVPVAMTTPKAPSRRRICSILEMADRYTCILLGCYTNYLSTWKFIMITM